MNLFTIPPDAPFLDAIAAAWLQQSGGDPSVVSDGLILLPTRRAARALAESFLRASNGRALLLPRITALGALDEAPLALAGALDLPPAVDDSVRLATLSRLILALRGAGGAPVTADRAWMLAGELASLMDEAERAEIDLRTALPEAADPAYAAHWARTLEFLHIVTDVWPDWLAEQGLMNPAARQVALLNAQAEAWRDSPPAQRVLAAGMTGAIPAVGRLIGVIARLDRGAAVLPGLDNALDDAAWDAIEPSHPQAGLRALLESLGCRRADVKPWPGAARDAGARVEALRHALLPGPALGRWPSLPPPHLAGLSRLAASDQQEEAAAIALILRGALEAPGARAALVTPDRELARRVAAELLRFDIVADDSAGEPLAETPPAVFLRLLARAVIDGLAPVPLMALLKHPMTSAGLSPAECRQAARALEIACLRGPRPERGLAGLRMAVRDHEDTGCGRLIERLESCIEPVLRIATAAVTSPSELFSALIQAGEFLAATDELPGPARLWAAEEGEALATQLSAIQAALPVLPDQKPSVLPGLLDAALEGAVVRTRRALRGRDGAEHPRVFIWGLLEARLQTAEVLVLGGLTESVWPPATEPGPWLSRPMRQRIGLPSPEERVGQSAHDFVLAASAAPEVILSCPRRRDGAPAVPSRWITRLDAMLAGHDFSLPLHPAANWARALDQPDGPPKPVPPPRPTPPVALRPRALSVTEIETWMRDPYAIHAKHILRLRRLDDLDQSTDAADYGSIVHAGLHRFLDEHGTKWPPDASGRLRRALEIELNAARPRRALAAWWSPRLARISDWVTETEAERRALRHPDRIWSEVTGKMVLARPGGDFILSGRADRIERYPDGALSILDYKTGTVPTEKSVATDYAPQLLLEAWMAGQGAFPGIQGKAAELIYWQLSGGPKAGEVSTLFKGDRDKTAQAVDSAQRTLAALIDAFDDSARAYLSRPRPEHAPRFSDYVQLARVAEWAAAEDA